MTVQLDIPETLVKQARELAEQQRVSVDQIVAVALTAQISAAAKRPSIAERAEQVDWQAVKDIMSRVPDVPPLPGDELPENWKK